MTLFRIFNSLSRISLNSAKFNKIGLSSVVNHNCQFFKSLFAPSSFSSRESSNFPINNGNFPKIKLLNDSNCKIENSLSLVKQFSLSTSSYRISLNRMHEKEPYRKKRRKINPLGPNVPFARGVILKTLIKKPRKPNSANRKCVLIRIPSGKELVAYVPGEGHNLQEHNVVLVKVGRLRDTPGVKVKCVRGKYDLGHVIKKKKY